MESSEMAQLFSFFQKDLAFPPLEQNFDWLHRNVSL
ncbi:hypothetical protein NIES4103_14540 [Nostoc sp. NIES-4103]|nr:hypothetical protein NIES4103_14540 [Nostoc sp. NIES-4103]